MKVALVVGHSERSQGAMNATYETTEYIFNKILAKQIVDKFSYVKDVKHIKEIEIVYRKNGYLRLPYEINELNPDLVVSLHCNAFDTKTNGCEVLYYHKSEIGKEVAGAIYNRLVNVMQNNDRGLKACDSEDRGGHLLKATKAPCVICEPFFIDNDDEYLFAKDLLESKELALHYILGIDEACGIIKEFK